MRDPEASGEYYSTMAVLLLLLLPCILAASLRNKERIWLKIFYLIYIIIIVFLGFIRGDSFTSFPTAPYLIAMYYPIIVYGIYNHYLGRVSSREEKLNILRGILKKIVTRFNEASVKGKMVHVAYACLFLFLLWIFIAALIYIFGVDGVYY